MKTFFYILVLLVCVSCKQKVDEAPKESTYSEKTNLGLNKLETDFIKWWTYHETNIILASDFRPLNEHSKPITKGEFLKKLTTGSYIPFKLDSLANSVPYKLFKLSDSADINIRSTIKNTSQESYDYYNLEGTSFPDFEFIDLNGTLHTKNTLKDKTLVLKCWFIGCKPCIAEFPELNELVEKNTDNNDILFVSLALDSEADLKKFLAKKEFKYHVVPGQEKFISEKLEVTVFPTHYVIDGNGIITKVVNKSTELISYLEGEFSTNQEEIKNLPPPPPPM